MKKIINVKIEDIEKKLKQLPEESINYVANVDIVDTEDNSKILAIDLISSNDYNCYIVSKNCSKLCEGEFASRKYKNNYINYLSNEINKETKGFIKVTLNLSDDSTGCDYEDEVYEYCANLIAKYHLEINR